MEWGVVAFLAVVLVLFAIPLTIARPYLRRGRSRNADQLTREIQLRDGSVGYPGTSSVMPPNRDPSPRDRLRSGDFDDS